MILQRRGWPALRRRDGKPLQHGNVECVADWPYSSFHRYVKAGIYPPDWVGRGTPAEVQGNKVEFGE